MKALEAVARCMKRVLLAPRLHLYEHVQGFGRSGFTPLLAAKWLMTSGARPQPLVRVHMRVSLPFSRD